MDGSGRTPDAAALAAHRDGLRDYLLSLGFAASGADAGLGDLDELCGWLTAEGLAPGDATEDAMARFMASVLPEGRALGRRRVERVIDYLRSVGAIPQASAAPADPVGELVATYRQYMREQRRLAPTTVHNASGVVRRFLSQRADRADVTSLDAAELHELVLRLAGRLAPGSMRTFVGTLRPFLRFLFATGRLSHNLSGAVPSVAGSRLASLPKAAEPAVVQALLASCDRTRRTGRRDFAILVLLWRLGLRAAEVAALCLEDLDWRAGEVIVHGKGGRVERLPLPADVGAAIADYLRHGRPPSDSRAVFLQAQTPAGPMTPNAVLFVPRTASRRLGIGIVGAHGLRHSAATAMLRSGASLREVGQVMRHYDDATTSIYAKVDRATLDLVVRAWPEHTS